MNFYNQQHQFYCGIDLHAKTMYVCILDSAGKKLAHRNIGTDPEYFLKVIAPYRQDIVVCVECMFSWYWVADLCAEEGIPFVLGHALYMRAIHGGKAKNDRIDSETIAVLLRGGLLPQSYVYPKKMRSTRDIMRRRTHFMRKRAQLLTHIQMTRMQYNLKEFGKSLARKRHRKEVSNLFSDKAARKSMEANLTMMEHYDEMLRDLELFINNSAKAHDPDAYRILRSIRGVGKILTLTILYEIDTIHRFPRVQDFLSYARLVKSKKESAGKNYGSSGSKIGNAHLKWAFSEAAILLMREYEEAKLFVKKKAKKHGKGKAMSILATKLGRAAYFMLKNKRSFRPEMFFSA